MEIHVELGPHSLYPLQALLIEILHQLIVNQCRSLLGSLIAALRQDFHSPLAVIEYRKKPLYGLGSSRIDQFQLLFGIAPAESLELRQQPDIAVLFLGKRGLKAGFRLFELSLRLLKFGIGLLKLCNPVRLLLVRSGLHCLIGSLLLPLLDFFFSL